MAKPDIDFIITSNTHHIKVADMSVWSYAEGKSTIIELTLPGFTNCKTFYFDQYKVNVFNSTILGITCASCGDSNKESLSDGIYKITVKASPDTFFKKSYYLKTDLFQMELDKLIIENRGSSNWRAFSNKLVEVEFLLAGAHSHLREGLIRGAGELWATAKDALEDLTGCSDCNRDVWVSS